MRGTPKKHSGTNRDDLKKLLALLKAEGVSRFKNGEIEVEFAPVAAPLADLGKLFGAAPKKDGKDEKPKSIYDDPALYDAVGGRPELADEGQAS